MNTNDFFDMLDAWYDTLNKKLEALQEAYPAPLDQDNREDMHGLYQFSQQLKISYTPAILLNGRLMSQLYSYKDLEGIARTINAEKDE
jgi:protein-disulfide isomerase